MNAQDIIGLYEAISAFTGDMLTAARAEDWELLAALECRCSAHVQTLKEEEPQQLALPGPEREQKIKLIQKILEDDLDLRKLTTARMEQLSSLINNAHTERKLSETYV